MTSSVVVNLEVPKWKTCYSYLLHEFYDSQEVPKWRIHPPTSCLNCLIYLCYIYHIRTFDDELVFIRQSTRYFHMIMFMHFNLPLNPRYSCTLFLRVEGLGVQPPPINPLADSQVEDLQNREYTRNPFLHLPLLGCNMLIYQITHNHTLYANALKQSKYMNVCLFYLMLILG